MIHSKAFGDYIGRNLSKDETPDWKIESFFSMSLTSVYDCRKWSAYSGIQRHTNGIHWISACAMLHLGAVCI